MAAIDIMHSLYYPDGQVAVGDPSRGAEWLHEIRKTDRLTAALIGQAIQHVIDGRGPDEGRPLVDRIKGSQLHRLKELRPASIGETEVRILFIFDPARQMVL
ncbi:MAG: type II toxin-antitoxin system RelE/ParE family toxin, partial [Gammaproteobacteria bacterium]